jgi:Transglycosylase-like domain
MKVLLAVLAVLTFVPTASASLMSRWAATARCESGGRWHINTGNGYYGGLQFDHWTWVRHGGLRYAYNAHQATPLQQVRIAERVSYDAWPNCPNP